MQLGAIPTSTTNCAIILPETLQTPKPRVLKLNRLRPTKSCNGSHRTYQDLARALPFPIRSANRTKTVQELNIPMKKQ